MSRNEPSSGHRAPRARPAATDRASRRRRATGQGSGAGGVRAVSPERGAARAPARSGPAERERRELTADCANCFGLCCVALPFVRSADFAVDKDAGQPCRNLDADHRCGIHGQLRERGFGGCAAFDCFGAGQRVSQVTFGGRDWRANPAQAGRMFRVLPVQRQLHELLWYVTEALDLPPARPVHRDLRRAHAALHALVRGDADTLLAVDVAGQRREVGDLLRRVSALVRAQVPGRPARRRQSDLVGARLAGARLRGADLRGACLIAADLSDADLRHADLLGADLRDADLAGADLTDSLFLTRSQLGAARGDAATRLPVHLPRPAHW